MDKLLNMLSLPRSNYGNTGYLDQPTMNSKEESVITISVTEELETTWPHC